MSCFAFVETVGKGLDAAIDQNLLARRAFVSKSTTLANKEVKRKIMLILKRETLWEAADLEV